MFRNYIKTAIRNLWRYKGFSLINIASLTIGIAGCLVIGVFILDELKYDKWVPEGKNIYRLYEERVDNGTATLAAVTAPAYADFLQRTYPEVDTTLRLLMSSDKFLLEAGEVKAYENKGWFVEPSFFVFFPLKFLAGDPATALKEPSSLVMSEELAKKYFGNENAIGKTIKLEKEDYTIRGVLAELPEHFHLDFNYLISLSSAGIKPERMQKWTWSQFYTYVKLKPETDYKHLEQKFQAHIKQEIFPTLTQDGSSFLPVFQPLGKIHLQSSSFVYDNAVRGNESYVKGLSIIAIFVLVIACFNFINLATARSFRRAKEIGVRKVIGAERKQLVFQFISETVLLAIFSALLATAVIVLVLPMLNSFTGKSISYNVIINPLAFVLIPAGAIVLGIIAGIYPAMVLSGFKPIKVLKANVITGKNASAGWLRQGLVVVQFTMSALLIVSATIVFRQIKFLNNKDLGFNKEQVMTFAAKGDVEKNIETFKDQLRAYPGIVSVTSGYGLPGDQYATDGILTPGADGNKDHSATHFMGDFDYVKTLGLKLIAGRDFSRNMATDKEEAFIINETGVKELGFGTPEKALGKDLYWPKWHKDSLNPLKKGKVIGVVKDFHYKSLHEKVSTSVVHIYDSALFKVAVRMRAEDVKSKIAFISATWNKFSPGFPIDYSFMDESYDKMYKAEEKLGTLLWIFTGMAIVVGCMGLFALAALSAQQRRKEIGIRKVLGAGVGSIIGLLSIRFMKLVLIASLLAFPIAWWAMNKWLDDFSYRVSISWWIFVVAAVAALLIAMLTVSFQAIKAAVANPVISLRSE
jgi:putative ABC transport system permease protein